MTQLLSAGTMSGEYTLLCKDGQTREVEYRSVAHILPGLHLAVYRDITERKAVEAALREHTQRLRFLSGRVVEVQEEERRHLARELHDEIGQTLTAIAINLRAVKNACGTSTPPRLEECIGIVGGAIQQVRSLSLDLRPSMLDDLGLVSALRWYVERQAERAGYCGHLAAEPDEMKVVPSIAIAAFRIAQEALTNVARHAGARHVWVKLRMHENQLELAVRDDGRGFDVGAMSARRSNTEAIGLMGMRERAMLLGGQVSIRSAKGRGTEIRLTVPLE
jgi:signal transduction histidine kinase